MLLRTACLTIISVLGVGLATAQAAPPGHRSGEWQLNPRLCPDLREDVRDRRYTYSRRDRREDRRDSRATVCPARAWTYVPSRYEQRRHGRDAWRYADRYRPAYTSIYVDRKGRYYGRLNGRDVRITIVHRG